MVFRVLDIILKNIFILDHHIQHLHFFLECLDERQHLFQLDHMRVGKIGQVPFDVFGYQ